MFTRFLKRTVQTAVVIMCAVPALVVGQGHDIAKILGDVRKALGTDKAAEVKTLSLTGRTQRSRPDGTSSEFAFEMFMELPDKFMKRDVVAAMGPTSIYRMSGFNGEGLINEVDTPPSLSTGGAMIRMMPASGPGSGAGRPQTPEQVEEARKRQLLNHRQDFARLALGLFGASTAPYPVELTYGGEAESADGKAYVVNVKGEGNFTARFFIDTKTNLPLMLSWMDKEPLQLTMNAGPGGGARAGGGGAGGGGMVVMGGGGHATAGGGTPADLERMQKEMDERIKEAEAKRRVVEYRLFYGDYKSFNGVKLPTRSQRMIDGTPADEMTFERVQVNGKIDPRKFEPTKSDKK
jgi:hypothetical protein